MKLKNPLAYGTYSFYLGEGESQIRIPSEGFVRSRRVMISSILGTLNALSDQGEEGYLQRAIEEADHMRLPLNAYIGKILEHQICLRSGGTNNGLCAPSGIGDKIHNFISKIDDSIAKAPSPIKKAIQRTISRVLLRKESGDIKRTGRASGCSACGGRRSFTKAAWNFGRAGRMQKKGE